MFEGVMAAAQQAQSSFILDIMEIASIVGLWKMFEKADQPGWAALIPFYNTYKLCEITMANPWYWLRLLVFCIPVVGWIAGFYFMYQIAVATALSYGKPDSWKWGFLFLSGIFYCITGFDQSEYYGPMGAEDRRTSQARQARTVNFDVIKNEPEQTVYTGSSEPAGAETYEAAEPAAAEEEVVDFIFDQPEE